MKNSKNNNILLGLSFFTFMYLVSIYPTNRTIRNKNHLKFRKILETDPTTYVDLSLFLMGRDCVPMLTFDLNNTCAQPVINKLRAIFVQIKSQQSIITFFKIYV